MYKAASKWLARRRRRSSPEVFTLRRHKLLNDMALFFRWCNDRLVRQTWSRKLLTLAVFAIVSYLVMFFLVVHPQQTAAIFRLFWRKNHIGRQSVDHEHRYSRGHHSGEVVSPSIECARSAAQSSGHSSFWTTTTEMKSAEEEETCAAQFLLDYESYCRKSLLPSESNVKDYFTAALRLGGADAASCICPCRPETIRKCSLSLYLPSEYSS